MAYNYKEEEVKDKLGLTSSDDGESLNNNSEKKWNSWDQQSGKDVQGFIKKQLANSVSTIDFDQTDTSLILKNSLGDVVGTTKVEISYPEYSIKEVNIKNITLNGAEIKSDTTIINGNGIKNNSTVNNNTITFTWNLVNTTKNEEYCLNQVNYTIYLLDSGKEEYASMTGSASYSENGKTVDISSLFADVNSSGSFYLRVEIDYSYFNGTQTENRNNVSDYSTKLSIQIISLECRVTNWTNSYDVPFTYTVDDYDKFILEYSINGSNYTTVNLNSAASTSLNLEPYVGEETVKTFTILARLKTKANVTTLMSDWITSNFIYQNPNSSGSGAKAFITNVPETITNCDSAQVFSITTTDKLQGDIVVYVYKDSKASSFLKNISIDSASDYYFKNQEAYRTFEISLSTLDSTSTTPYYVYNELTDSNNSIYLAFVVDYGKSAEIYKVYTGVNSYTANGSPQSSKYTSIKIENPAEGISRYVPVKNSIINFGQANTLAYPFSDDTNINSSLDSSCGLQQEGKYTFFKISPTSGGLFNTPVDINNSTETYLASSSNKDFSIEITLKTYNVTDESDEIMNIGNIRFYTNCIRLLTDGVSDDLSKPYIAGCANFAKDEITHITITYNHAYKPTTYENYLNDMYPGYKDLNSGLLQCLKIYINGEINRSVSVFNFNGLLENNKFTLQINPSYSDVNIYSLRTYDKCLSKEEVLQNKIASFASYVDKKAFFEKNDLTYLEEDYNAINWKKIQEEGLANTISIRKCLGKIDPNYNNLANSKKFTQKNVMLLVVGDEGPLYYGNKKHENENGEVIKPQDATMLIKYAPPSGQEDIYKEKYNGKFIGKYLTYENGYDSYYKSQGSSAKRYGGAYNVQFSKFYFVPESKFETLKEVLTDKSKYNSEQSIIYDKENNTCKYDMTILNYYDNMLSAGLASNTIKNKTYDFTDTSCYTDRDGYHFNEVFEAMGINDTYVLPTDSSGAEVVKLVGKVNYASSMQSHKQGACNLYADCYPKDFANYKDDNFDAEADVDYMRRRAVKEDVFYYFFIKLSDCKHNATYRDVTWDDIDFDKVHFFGFQTWGSAKMDNETFGYNKKANIGYLVVEGADNKNAQTNFKSPWAAMQIWNTNNKGQRINSNGEVIDNKPYYDLISGQQLDYVEKQQSGLNSEGNPDYLTGLLYNDETIMAKRPSADEIAKGDDAISRGPDAWDIAGALLTESTVDPIFEVKEFKTGNKDSSETSKIHPATESLEKFAAFSNYIYTFDFGNLVLFDPEEGLTKENNSAYKYVANDDYTNINIGGTTLSGNAGDIFRYDQIKEIFVPAGLYYNTANNKWETLNIFNIVNDIKDSFDEYKANSTNEKPYTTLIKSAVKNNAGNIKGLFSQDVDDTYSITNIDVSVLRNKFGQTDAEEDALNKLKCVLADAFKCTIYAYCDVESFCYHQAAIRFLSGTDNRAKNIYFVIQGGNYKKEQNTGGIDVYNQLPDNKQYKNGELITLFQDDMDTIFATDNNGQQAKEYNLVEPAYNNNTSEYWGDSRSGLWYNFDILFEENIKEQLKKIIEHVLATNKTSNTIINTDNNLYKDFLSIQDELIPAVGYNHTSEVYYDIMQLCYSNGNLTTFGSEINKFDSEFNNNQVANPESLIHGGCLESEKEFLKKRIAFLASYANATFTSEDMDTISLKSNTSGGSITKKTIKLKNTSFIQDYYPNFLGGVLNEENSNADAIINEYYATYNGGKSNSYSEGIAYKENSYPFTIELTADLTQNNTVTHTDYIDKITFQEGVNSLGNIYLKKAQIVCYEEPEETSLLDSDKGINFVFGSNSDSLDMSKIVPNVETLKIPYSHFEKSILNFQNCTRLKELDLTKSINDKNTITFDNILLPKNNKLTSCVLPVGTKALTAYYYPNITADTITFAGDTQLTSLVIDWRNNWAEEFIKKYFAGTSDSTLVLTNVPSKTKMSKYMLNLLTSVKNFSFSNKVTITMDESEGAMDVILKKKLAKLFGNIDNSTNDVYITYSKDGKDVSSIDFGTSQITLKQGVRQIPYKLLASDNTDAVAVELTDEGLLNLSFKLTDAPNGVSCDEEGNITIPSDISNGKNFTFTITYKNTKTASCKVIVGFYCPNAGDFANYDGSFSPIYNADTAIGFVYYVANKTDNSATVSVMSLSPLKSCLPSAANNADLVFRYGDTENDTNYTNEYKVATDIVSGKGYEIIVSDDFKTESESSDVYDQQVDQNTSVVPTSSSTIMAKYIKKGVYSYNKLLDGNITSNDKDKFESIIKEIYNYSSAFTVGDASASGKEMLPFLYPAYLRTACFLPENIDNTTKYYGYSSKYAWEIPNSYTVAYLLNQVIISSSGLVDNDENNNKTLWTNYANFSKDENTLFGYITANNGNCNMIQWLKNTRKITCECGIIFKWKKCSRSVGNRAYHQYDYNNDTYFGFEYNNYNTGGESISLPDKSDCIFPCITFNISADD